MTQPAPDQVTVTLKDMVNAGHCIPGIRSWFNTYNRRIGGFPSYATFIETREINGATFLSTEDAYAVTIYALKMSREYPNGSG